MSKRPFRSGHCGLTNPANIHRQCTGAYAGLTCSCRCHQTTEETTVTETIDAPAEVECPCLPGAPQHEHGKGGYAANMPGLVSGMSDQVYHADPVGGGSLSSTFARLLTNHVPAKALEVRRNRKPTKAMNLGKAVHAHALGTGPQLIVWEHDGRTRDGKAERAAVADLIASEAAVGVTAAERDQIEGMVAALRADAEVAAILEECEAEVSGFWLEGSTWLRARYDLLGKDRAWDYKTCEDSTRRGFSKAMASYGYHQQGEFYGRGLRAFGHPAGNVPLRFICQETQPPYLVQIHEPDETALEVARELNDRAIRLYAACKESGEWPGHPSLYAEPAPLPSFYYYDHAEVLPDHWQAEAELKLA